MRFGIESVVNRMTIPSTQTQIMPYDRRTAAIRQDEIEIRNQRAKRIVMLSFNSGQSGRSIHVPERAERIALDAASDSKLKLRIVGAHAAMLDDQIGARRS